MSDTYKVTANLKVPGTDRSLQVCREGHSHDEVVKLLMSAVSAFRKDNKVGKTAPIYMEYTVSKGSVVVEGGAGPQYATAFCRQ